MDLGNITIYRRVIAIAVMVVLIWVGWLFYRIFREGAIKKADFYKANWKIGLFWLAVIAATVLAWYFWTQKDQ